MTRQSFRQRAVLAYEWQRERRCEVCRSHLGFHTYRHRVTHALMCSQPCYDRHDEAWKRQQALRAAAGRVS